MLSADLHTEVSGARKIYMLAYEKALATYRQRFAASAPEAIFEIKDSSEAAPFRFFRVDLCSGSVSPPNVTKVEGPKPAPHPPRGIRLPTGMHIILHPIAWYRIEFHFGTQVTDDANLLRWCSLWLDLDEHRKPDARGFSGVIHSVTPLAFAENRSISAPPQSWHSRSALQNFTAPGPVP